MAAITVVGGINIDIEGSPYGTLIPEDSNPGKVSIAYGGVGRNIARLGGDVGMVSLTGADVMGVNAREHLVKLGVDVTYIEHIPGESTGMYLSILNHLNDMELAICNIRAGICIKG